MEPPHLAAPEPVLPDYDGGCIANLVPALMTRDGSGSLSSWLPAGVAEASQVVLLVLDGLGWHQLRSRAHLAPTLSSGAGIDAAITSVAPTTTATALTSIATGTRPATHGILGYRMAQEEDIFNVLLWLAGSQRPADARRTHPPADLQRQPIFPGALGPVPIVSKQEFGSTGFTAAHLGTSVLHGYRMPSSLPIEVGKLLRAGAPFIYAYYDGVDKIAHAHGLGEHYDAELHAADRIVADLVAQLPAGAVLVVTADHGQVDVGSALEVLGPSLMSGVRFLSGEGRFRWLHVRDGAAADVLAEAEERYATTTWVRGVDELLDGGWFGGATDFRDRLGDVALIPFAPIAFADPADTGENRLFARHGSLTPDEMHVPLLAFSR